MAKETSTLNAIPCPSCGEPIDINETLYHQIAEKAQAGAKAETLKQQKLLEEKEKQLKEKEAAVEQTVQSKLKVERAQLELEAKEQAKKQVSVELEDLKRQSIEKDARLAEAQKSELELRKQKREIEEREKNLELETARRMDDERKKVQEETAARIEEGHRLKDAEKDKKFQDVLKANEEMRRKLEQGSQQTQGEVLELELEEMIRVNFPNDTIEPVPKGVNGADVIHKVVSKAGHPCGTIVWESKHTKAWTEGWVGKLKDDVRLVKGDMAILVTEVLPKGVKNFVHLNGVWVTNAQCALPLAVALRSQLLEVATTKLAAVGKNEKMEVLYQYISGSEFRQKVEAIVESFVEMHSDLQDERRVAERRWSKREKQIQRVISNTAGMYGDFQGLIGSSLQSIPSLASGEAGETQDVEETETIDPDKIPF